MTAATDPRYLVPTRGCHTHIRDLAPERLASVGLREPVAIVHDVQRDRADEHDRRGEEGRPAEHEPQAHGAIEPGRERLVAGVLQHHQAVALLHQVAGDAMAHQADADKSKAFHKLLRVRVERRFYLPCSRHHKG